MVKTPFELLSKGQPHFLSAFATAGLSRAGGECFDTGANKSWLAGLIAAERPEVTSAFRRLVLAHGAVLLGGHVQGLRRVRIRRPSGFPALRLHPVAGWTREGVLAGPVARLP